MSYNGCKIRDYSHINPNTGAGFILTRLAAGDMTKREVYEETHYARRFGPGYHSSIWAKLLEDGLIESDGGFKIVKNGQAGGFNRWRSFTFKRAKSVGGRTPIYRLTVKGRKTFFEMMERATENYMKKKLFGNSKTVAGPRPEEWREDDFLEPGETKEEWAARNGVTLTEVPPGPAGREFNAKQKLDAIINDLMDLRDSLS